MIKIMIVDDEQDIRDSMKSILEAEGYQVDIAEDGDECLKLVQKEKYDLILLDILMPGTPVDEVLPHIGDIKVIMFSVVRLEEKNIAESGKKVPSKKDFSNIVDYIEKPMEMDIVLAKIRKALGNHES